MMFGKQLHRDDRGAAAIEVAFALPAFVLLIWTMMQLALVYRAVSGIQQALGQGARYATLCVNPSSTGCSSPTADQIKTRINNAVYGIGPGTFTVANPVSGISGTSKYYDLKVSYSQPTNMLVFPGPTVTVSRSKRVWIAAA